MRSVLVLTLLLAILASAAPALADAPRLGLTNLVVDNQGGRIKVRFGVDVKAVDAVKTALENGNALALECKVWLSRKRDYLWNTEESKTQTLSPLILHDGGPYEIIRTQGREEHFRGRDLSVLMKEAWGSMELDMGAWNMLSRGDSYSLSMEIRLVRQDISSWLKGALFFWNFDAVSPVKYQLDFSY